MTRPYHYRKRTPYEKLPNKQKEVIDFVRLVRDEKRRMPSYKEIADHMGWKNADSAKDCIVRLQMRGWAMRHRPNEFVIIDEVPA